MSFCGALADAYLKGASELGHAVHRCIWPVFDPILKSGYAEEQTLESDLVNVQEQIIRARSPCLCLSHLVGGALLKGFIDRVFYLGLRSSSIGKIHCGGTSC